MEDILWRSNHTLHTIYGLTHSTNRVYHYLLRKRLLKLNKL